MRVRRSCWWALIALTIPALHCSTVSRAVGTVTGSTQRKELRAQLAEIQTAVMRISDSYTAAIVEDTAAVPANTVQQRTVVLEYQIDQLTAVYQIATAPNPQVNAVDMALLTTLSRRVAEQYWVPVVWGEAGRPMVRSYKALERQAWDVVSGFMDESQQQILRDLIVKFHEAYPGLKQAAFIRVTDLAQSRSKRADGLGSPTEILGSIGLDIFGGLDPAVEQIDRTRILAERALFYAQRSPRLLDLQMQLLTLQLSQQPASQQLIDNTTRISKSAEDMATVAALLPSTIDQQREAAIRQFMDALQDQEARSRELLMEVRQTLQAGAGAADSVNEAIRSANLLLATVKPPPVPGAALPPPSPPGKPFDIAEYTEALGELGKTAAELEALVATLDRTLPRVQALATEVTGQATGEVRALVNHALLAGLALVGAIFLAAPGYRWAAVRMTRHAMPT